METVEERTNTLVIMGPPFTRKQIIRTAFYATTTVIATAAVVNVAADAVIKKFRTKLDAKPESEEVEASQELQAL